MLNMIESINFTKSWYFIAFFIAFSITLFGYISAEAQDSENSNCLKKCKNVVLDGITECKDSAKQCVRDNAQNHLHVLDYCTDSYLETCEGTVRGRYESCISEMCGVNITESRSEAEFDPDDPTAGPSCATGGDEVINAVLDEMVILANAEWEQAACDFGLCPLSPVYDGKINLGCGGDLEALLIAACTTSSAGTTPDCKSFYVDIDADYLNGLQFARYDDFMVTEINGASGTQPCPNSSTANDGLDFTCSYSGTGTGSSTLSMEEITLDVSSVEVKLKCTNGIFDEDFTLYKGKFSCTTSNPTATAKYAFCGGSCDQDGNDGGVITYFQVPSSSDLSLDLGSTFKCVFDPETDPVNAFLDEFVPLFKDQIADALKQPLQETVNAIIPSLPFPPSTCEGS